jgi:hypothetical protein
MKPLGGWPILAEQGWGFRLLIRINFYSLSVIYLVLSTIVFLTYTRQPRYPETQTRMIRPVLIPKTDLASPAGLKKTSIEASGVGHALRA